MLSLGRVVTSSQSEAQRYYLIAKSDELLRLQALLGRGKFQILDVSGGKFLLTNRPFMSQ
jgi:hypothetical protein